MSYSHLTFCVNIITRFVLKSIKIKLIKNYFTTKCDFIIDFFTLCDIIRLR
nr:MAG TPA: hypothetical protein [Caudoviricetes sp.]